MPDLVTRRPAATATAMATAMALAGLPSGAALARAPAHPQLWATINVCDPPARPGAVGVRISIPREKGAPRQWARIRLQFFDGRAWHRVRAGGDTGFARYGIGTRLVQGGTTFTFPSPAAGSRLVLRGLVDVEWRRGTTVVDRAQLRTTAGHADPNDRTLRQSGATCVIKR